MLISEPQFLLWQEDDDPEVACYPVPSERPPESCLVWLKSAGIFVCVSAVGYSQMHFYNSAAPLVRAVAGLACGVCAGSAAVASAVIEPQVAAADVRACWQLVDPGFSLTEHSRVTARVRELLARLAHRLPQCLSGLEREHQDVVRHLLFMGCHLMVGRFGDDALDVEQTGALAGLLARGGEADFIAAIQTVGAMVPAEEGANDHDWQANVCLNGIGLSGPPNSEVIEPSFADPPSLGSVALRPGDHVVITSQGAYVRMARRHSWSLFEPLLGSNSRSLRARLLRVSGPVEAVPWHGFCARFSVR